MIRETGDIRDNGLQEIYVNTKIEDGSDIAELMKIYKEQNVFDYVKFPKTSKRKQQFIGNEREHSEMCEIVDNYANEVAKEAAKEAAKEMAEEFLKKGVDFDVVCQCISKLSKEELSAIYENIRRNG